MAMHIFSAGTCPVCKKQSWNDDIAWSKAWNGYICKACAKKEEGNVVKEAE
jgi:hypothetical protein